MVRNLDKKSAAYLVDKEVLEQFNKIAKENALNKSKWIENKMKEYVTEVERKMCIETLKTNLEKLSKGEE